MNKLEPKNTTGEGQQRSSERRERTEAPVPHAPGGPGWISEHSGMLWLAGFLIAVAALVVYMIIDNS